MLPDELQHESVIESRNRCEPKHDCYQVILDDPECQSSYRPQWKDDWEILGATIENHNGHDRLRLTLIERTKERPWRPAALLTAGALTAVSYRWYGTWLHELGWIGDTAFAAGGWLSNLSLIAAVVCLLAWAALEHRNPGVTRP